MRIIGPLDQKPFFGVAIAVVSGLMLGGSMKPDLNEEALFRAPQLLSPVSADRVEFIDGRASVDSYRYGLPDWVIGTDALRPAYPEPERAAEAPVEETYEVAAWEPPPARAVSYSEPDREASEPRYPSMGGDILQGVEQAPTAEAEAADDESAPPSEPVLG